MLIIYTLFCIIVSSLYLTWLEMLHRLMIKSIYIYIYIYENQSFFYKIKLCLNSYSKRQIVIFTWFNFLYNNPFVHCTRLYQYIHGANSNSSKIAFTAPVLTSVPSSPPGDGYIVRMFVSTHFQGKPPQPNPELKLRIEKWKTQCIAVRKFTGYAKDDNINKEIEALVTTLNKNSATIQDTSFYTIAKYNASSHNTADRLNEVWIKVSGVRTEYC